MNLSIRGKYIILNTWKKCSIKYLHAKKDITSRLLEWLLSEKQEMTSVGEHVEKSNAYTILVGM